VLAGIWPDMLDAPECYRRATFDAVHLLELEDCPLFSELSHFHPLNPLLIRSVLNAVPTTIQFPVIGYAIVCTINRPMRRIALLCSRAG